MEIEVDSASISIDEGSTLWTGNFILTNHQDGGLFPVGAPFSFYIVGEEYKFIVTQTQITKSSPANYTMTINGLSPAVQLTSPLAQSITKTWGTTTARTVVEEVLMGYPLQWDILDWPFPANLFAVSEQMPLEIVRSIANAAGAVAECLPDGTLRVRYRFPVSVLQYGPMVADHLFSEPDDILEGGSGFAATKIVNKLRVMNAQVTQQADRLEFTEDTPGIGKVFAYPNPWRTSFEVVSTNASVVISQPVYGEREEEEVIEIANGKGSVKYPIMSILSTEFLDFDLLGVTFSEGSNEVTTTHETEFYSLLRIRYKVRSLIYNVVGPAGVTVQFLMKET